MSTAQRAALCRITAEVEAAKPDREALAAYVRQALEDVPQVSSCIGWHMRRDVVEAMERLLEGWNCGQET